MRPRPERSPGSSRLDRLLERERPYAKWYLGGKLNVCFNCVDRHVEGREWCSGRVQLA